MKTLECQRFLLYNDPVTDYYTFGSLEGFAHG